MTSRPLLGLNKAKLYESYHSMQHRDACVALRQYMPKMKMGTEVLDIGCGPGDLTYKSLLPRIPKHGKMIGIDVSPHMIQFANTKFDDPRLKFEVMDITDAAVAKKYERAFDSIFSFYCLHWIQDQWATMKNIFDILEEGGETLLVFLASCPIYTLYEKMSHNKKWAPYMQDYKKFMSPYHGSTDPETDVKNLLSKIGFDVIDCHCKPTTYSMSSCEILNKSVQAVNPFLRRIPENLLEEYNEDCGKEISSLCTIFDDTGEVSFTYSLITVYANKPCKIH